jgi:hypothetical protein
MPSLTNGGDPAFAHEAELPARDADLLTTDLTELRTAAQRRAEALVLLAQRVTESPVSCAGLVTAWSVAT